MGLNDSERGTSPPSSHYFEGSFSGVLGCISKVVSLKRIANKTMSFYMGHRKEVDIIINNMVVKRWKNI